MRIAVVSLLSLLAATGCVRQESLQPVEFVGDAPLQPPDPVVVADVSVAPNGVESSPPPRATPSLRPSDEPVTFLLGAGYGALGHIDLEPCRESGLPSGYLRMRVTFRPGGGVARAAVESLAQPPAEALSCVGQHLAAAMVPAFDGSDVTLSKSFFVGADGDARGLGPAILVQRETVRDTGRP
jgi:hypothetical protein